ncbi:hypothetical protein DITRI_Ditri04bG0007500 [Diplodiscus trichospermus]
MAAVLQSRSEAGEYNGRMTLLLVFSCLMAATGGVLFGYDIGISGGVTSMDPFLNEFFPKVYRKMKEDTRISNYCKFDSQLLSLFTSSLYIAGLITSLLKSTLTRALGRKPLILVGGAAFLAGSAIGGGALNIYMLILGRVLLGVGIGFTNQSVPIYISEMALPRYRGALNIGFEVGINIGVLVANLTNFGTEKIKGNWGWRISLAMAAVPALVVTLSTLFLPETPNSLIQQNSNHHKKAKHVLQHVRGTVDVQAELDDLIKARSISKTMEHPFKKIIQRKYRPQFVMSMAIPFFQQLTGIDVLTFYAPILFRTIGLGESTSLLSPIVIGIVGLASLSISMLVVDKYRRRALFIIGGALMLMSQLVVGGIMAAMLGDQGVLSQGCTYLILVMICVYLIGFSLSWGPLGWLVTSEIYPLEIRSAGQSVTVAMSFLLCFLVGQTFLAMLCHMKSGIFFFFGGWVAVMTAFVYFLLPETKNLPIEQMEKVWREHWFWRRFKEEDQVTKMQNVSSLGFHAESRIQAIT